MLDSEFLKVVKEYSPESIVEQGSEESVDYKSLCCALINEIIDLRERNEEKEYQIFHIMKEIDALKNR